MRIITVTLYFALFSVAVLGQGSLGALSFNGTDEWVDCSGNQGAKTSPGSLNLPTETITLEAWVYPRTYETWNSIVSFLQDNGTVEKGWDIEFRDNGRFAFALSTDGSLTYMETINQYSSNTWHHIAATYDGTTMRLYVNGILDVLGTTENGPIDYLDSWLSIGAYKDDNEERCIDAVIDEVRIWDVARNENEIRQFMCQNLQGSESGLTHYYRLNGTSPTNITDSGPNAFNGVFNQMDATNRVVSGAAIGNVSTFLYTNNWSNQSINLSSVNGSTTVENISSNMKGVQLYHVASTPSNTNGIDDLMMNSNYFGVFPIGSGNDSYDISYDYTGYSEAETNENIILLYNRESNSSQVWQDILASVDINNNTLTQTTLTSSKEVILGFFTSGCNPPVNFAASNTTAFQTELSWTTGGATSWNIEYGTPGYSPGTGALLNSTSNPYVLNGLQPSTDYDIYVQDDCGSFGVSNWTGPISIKTDMAETATCNITESVADWCYSSDQDNAQLGSDLSVSGDFNNDGFLDIAISSTAYFENNINGAVFIFLGSDSGYGTSPDQIIQSPIAGIEFGQALKIVGDMNGDGFDELAVGAPFYDIGNGVNDGIIYIYNGSVNGVEPTNPWTYTSGGTQRQLGAEITSGDYNNDGYKDVAVARPGLYWTNSQRIIIIYGSNSGPSSVEFISNINWQNFGFAMESIDLNNDGYDDLVIGSPDYQSDPLEEAEGSVVVHAGSANGLEANASWSYESNNVNFQLGFRIHSVGDINNDGYEDFGATAKRYESVESIEGGVYLFLGNGVLSSISFHQILEPNISFQSFGQSISGGDLNNDGFSEIFVGNPSDPQYGGSSGAILQFANNAGSIDPNPEWSTGILGPQNGFGNKHELTDLDNDGFLDLVVAATKYDHNGDDRGAVLVYYSVQGMFNDQLSLPFEELSVSSVTIYPNPIDTEKESLKIKAGNLVNSITVYDLQGRQIKTDWTQTGNVYECVLPDLESGTYLVKMNITENQSVTEMLIIR